VRDERHEALRTVVEANLRADVFLLTGDLADSGEPACYADLREVVTDATSRFGAKVIYLPGNHDDRCAFREYLLDEPPTISPINQVHFHEGLRVVALDSTVPGDAWGVLSKSTMAYLKEILAEPSAEGTVLAFHHPPVASPIAEMARLSLRRPAELARALAGSDVRVVLCGHYHHALASAVGSVPLWVSPALAYRADLTSTTVFRGKPGAAFSRIDLLGGVARATLIQIED
jgi:Icc protein